MAAGLYENAGQDPTATPNPTAGLDDSIDASPAPLHPAPLPTLLPTLIVVPHASYRTVRLALAGRLRRQVEVQPAM